jgi:hypothetical protein
MRGQTVQTQEMTRLGDARDTRAREGLVTKVHKGDGPAREQSVARALAQYVVRPPLALQRIDRYEGHRVTSPSRSHPRERVEQETVAVDTCIGRMIPHVVPKSFHRIRSDGVQATTTFAALQGLMPEALAKVKDMLKGALKSIAPMTYRQCDQQSSGRDPLRCPHCQSDMGVWRIWPPTSGVIHEELEARKRGKDAAQTPPAAPVGEPGRTLWSTSEGIPLSLPGLP